MGGCGSKPSHVKVSDEAAPPPPPPPPPPAPSGGGPGAVGAGSSRSGGGRNSSAAGTNKPPLPERPSGPGSRPIRQSSSGSERNARRGTAAAAAGAPPPPAPSLGDGGGGSSSSGRVRQQNQSRGGGSGSGSVQQPSASSSHSNRSSAAGPGPSAAAAAPSGPPPSGRKSGSIPSSKPPLADPSRKRRSSAEAPPSVVGGPASSGGAAAAEAAAGGGDGAAVGVGTSSSSGHGSDRCDSQHSASATAATAAGGGEKSGERSSGQSWAHKRLSAAAGVIPRVASRENLVNGSRHGSNTSATSANNISNNRAAAAANAEPYSPGNATWEALYSKHRHQISDPADVHSILDEQISSTVDLLSPAEITLIQRRVRDVVRSVTQQPNTKGKGMGAKTTLGRLTGVSGAKHKNDDDERSKQTYQRENVLDENLVRQVFVGGERVLARVYENGVARGSRTVFVRRREAGRSAASSPIAGASSGGSGGGGSGTSSSPIRKNILYGAARGQNAQQPQQYEGNADPVGSAHVLMLHMAEPRWDRVATVAKLSAARAGLEMDVNKAAAAAAAAGRASKAGGGDKAASAPPPAPRYAIAEAYGEAGAGLAAASPLPGGATMTSLCYLIALALRGSRSQRLSLLYYILLPSDQLRDLLDGHCAGGVPTWLLEPGTESSCIVSYASLSHYYYHGGGLGGSSAAAGENGASSSSSSSSRRLVLSASRAIGCIASLLMDALGGAEKPGSVTADMAATAAATGDGSNGSSRTGSLLSQSLAECRENKPKSFRRGLSLDVKESVMDQFWSNSYALFDNPETADVFWTPDEFVTWAENALCGELSRKVGYDVVLEMITHRLFGTGVLPTPTIERTLISSAWVAWQKMDGKIATAPGPNSEGDGSWEDYLCNIGETLRDYLGDGSMESGAAAPPPPASLPWGGVGGIDGWGGLGRGVMYCIDRKWWEEWAAYVGWTWGGDDSQKASKMRSKRPNEISTEALLANNASTWSFCPSGTLGSYEYMISDIARGQDYVLIPSAVWDLLYELYGGGPPLPRMVLPPSAENGAAKGNMINSFVADEFGSGVEVVAEARDSKPLRIPPQVNVATHPWILHCHICDPHQPYRRGDAGPVSIRIMATPDQPLWRLLGEIIVRLPVQHPKARDASGLGRARLWKQTDLPAASATIGGDAVTPGGGRYGPWMLLCKNRSACFPAGGGGFTGPDAIEFMRMDWLDYTDNGSVESAGLADGARLMFEYALMAKDGKFAWPREAAAKAGRVRQLADEDAAFRLTLRGLDSEGKLIGGKPAMLGKNVDAMDISGRWYKRDILEVDTQGPNDNNGDGDGQNTEQSDFIPGEVKAVRVDFTECGGHEEWIDVRSDRLAVPGRFTIDSDLESSNDEGEEGKGAAATNKLGAKEPSTSELVAAGKVCSFPGYGACGLTNLGNTCYANAALECISYIPLLRSYLISGQYKVNGDLNKDNPLGTGGKVLEEFSDLLRVMYSGKYGVRAPSKLKGQLAKARSQYAGADQQDAQELLNDMLDCLHEDSNKVTKKPYVEALEDDWVKHTGLPRVGQEAWRRFLRRNRSSIADVAMGQVLNRVTCPTCKHESRNFDPFNMLSIPFPTVAEVIFRCRIVRRGTQLNCPGTLGKSKHSNEGDLRSKKVLSPPSGKLIIEEYVIPMSRLADVGDLRLRLQNISGISANRIRLCKTDEIVVNAAVSQSNDPSRTYFKVTPLPEKEGPCIQLARQLSGTKQSQTAEDIASPSITNIIAFETTLSPRPSLPDDDDNDVRASNTAENADLTDEETEDEDDEDAVSRKAYQRILAKQLAVYGDKEECRLYDTNPTPLSKAMSRSLWPKSAADFKLGLRVDAIDHRSHWFPGSVVEIIEGTNDADKESPEGDDKGDDNSTGKTKVRIHFDNFSSKWDETYTIDHFKRGRVRPLYSHATPRPKPTEFLIHHRHKFKTGNALFGQPFYLQCHNEWSTARAGAHILAQASRFMQDNEAGRRQPSDSFYQSSEKARSIMAQIIDMLIDADRKYVETALRPNADKKSSGIRRSTSANAMSQKLSKKLSTLIPLLPFDVRVCTADSPLGGHQGNSSDEVAFPFSLVRTIGNYMNARHAVVLHWREKATAKNTERPRHPLLYVNPVVGIHERSKGVLEADAAAKAAAGNGQAHGGVQLGVCLDEFCKEQHLPETDSWRCPNCKEIREGKQHMILWRLPDILVFHLKRFNCSARWREKITTKVNFPLTGLNMSEWCDEESPFLEGSDESCVYDLIGVMNHYGGMTGGHYVATCKATPCGTDGSEEVAYNFNGAGVSEIGTEEETTQSVWKGLGRSKEKDAASASSKAATAAARFVAESSEPLWLQFDDDLVDPIPPKHVVSEMAYVLFYRRRRISPSNIAKYSTLE